MTRKIQTEVLVIGGGATGAGVARDLALRGFGVVLVERGDLTDGTTGRYHGLLHSGARYVVRDPQAAKECIEENRILRRIMPQCIEDTGGFFVLTPYDDPDYVQPFIAGCQKAGIPVQEITPAEMLRQEPLLNPQITRCFHVPDGSADAFLGTDLCARSAREHGAWIMPYHPVVELLRSGERVTGAMCHDRVHDELVQIDADMVVNAAGAWAGRIAASLGIPIGIVPGKGVMIAANHRIVNTVINRCKPPSDGDILVPAHTVAVIGTTDVKVDDPDRLSIEPWEIHLMLTEGERIVPGFMRMRMLRAWAGVRPLYQESGGATGAAGAAGDSRLVTRAYVLLDHAERDGIDGLVTITSGKWTTYRLMAEVTADLVCRKLNVVRPCKTHLESLPGATVKHNRPSNRRRSLPPGARQISESEPTWRSLFRKAAAHRPWRGERLAEVEHDESYGRLVCECELATVEQVEAAIDAGAQTLDDIRRDVRLGMGPCQGGFCTFRAAGMLHHRRSAYTGVFNALHANLALHDFLLERWKGLVPVLWGQQLRQERLNELIYLSLYNADHLPGARRGPLTPELYEPPATESRPRIESEPASAVEAAPSRTGPSTALSSKAEAASAVSFMQSGEVADRFDGAQREEKGRVQGAAVRRHPDLLVVGAGLAGLTAAWQAAERGLRVRLVAKGWGALYWHAGCIDVLGYPPTADDNDLARTQFNSASDIYTQNASSAQVFSASQPAAALAGMEAEAADAAKNSAPWIESPAAALTRLAARHPNHPYARAGLDSVRQALAALQQLAAEAGYPLHGSLERNWLLPGALGVPRPTCLAPETMVAGDLRRDDPILVVGIAGFPDFYPEWIADNLAFNGIPARGVQIDLPELRRRDWLTGRVLAAHFSRPDFRQAVAQAILAEHARTPSAGAWRVALPAVLGQLDAVTVVRHLQDLLQMLVFEIPVAPPSIPGMRLSTILTRAVRRLGGRVFEGQQVTGCQADAAGRLDLLWSEAAARPTPHRAANFILATGGLLGGGLRADYGGEVVETACGLPVAAPPDRSAWFERQFLGRSHPIYTAGPTIDAHFRPLGRDGRPAYPNLHAVGGLLGGCDPLHERSLEGVALATAFSVVNNHLEA